MKNINTMMESAVESRVGTVEVDTRIASSKHYFKNKLDRKIGNLVVSERLEASTTPQL